MPPELVEVTKALVDQRLTGGLLLVGLLSIAAAMAGAFFGAYFKKSAEYLVQRRFHDEILEQVRDQTKVVETTKTELARDLAAFSEDLKAQSATFQELLKQQLARENIDYQNRVAALGETARLVGAGSHNICWVSWVASNHPDTLSQALMTQYDADMHQVLSKIVGARVTLATLSPSVHAALSPKIEELYELDRRAGDATRRFSRSPEHGRQDWAKLYSDTRRFDDEFLREAIRVAPGLASDA